MTNLDEHGQPVDRGWNGERRLQRDVAEMLGLARGVLADGVVSEEEAMGLMGWAETHPDVIGDWPGTVLYQRLKTIFRDGYASAEEREDLGELLREMVGGDCDSMAGPRVPTELPLDHPVPRIEIPDRVFVFTGRFAFGPRVACEEAVRRLAGWVEPDITQQTDFLVIGTFASRDWVQASYGRKILKAVEYRQRFSAPAIITEQHWVENL